MRASASSWQQENTLKVKEKALHDLMGAIWEVMIDSYNAENMNVRQLELVITTYTSKYVRGEWLF